MVEEYQLELEKEKSLMQNSCQRHEAHAMRNYTSLAVLTIPPTMGNKLWPTYKSAKEMHRGQGAMEWDDILRFG